MKVNIFLSFFVILILSVQARAACYVDMSLDCQSSSSGLSWSPRSVNQRQILFNSSEVQTNSNSCQMFAKLLKSECNINLPVTTVFVKKINPNSAEQVGITTLVTGIDKSLSTKTVPQVFKDYFIGKKFLAIPPKKQIDAINSFADPISSSQTLKLTSMKCGLNDQSTSTSMLANFVSTNGCLFSYRCQASIAGGIGDTIVIQKVPVKNNYQFFCSQQDGVQVIIDIINRMADNAANTKPNTLYGDFTMFDFPSINANNTQLISKMDALLPQASKKNMAAADLATSVTMMGIGLKNLVPFLKTNGSFDAYTAANLYAEPIVSLCDATRAGALKCHYKNTSGSSWQQYTVRDQLNQLWSNQTIGGVAPPSAKYFGYVGDSTTVNASLDRSKMLEATYGKTIFNYLAINIRNLLRLRTGIVLAFVDASVKSGEPFTATVKGLSNGKIVAITSNGYNVELTFKVDRFQFSTNSTPSQSWIPVGMYTANPWPISDMGAYRTNMNTALDQAATAGTYAAGSFITSDDSKKCTTSSIGAITVGNVAYKFKNSQLGGGNFSNKIFPCRGLFKNSSGTYDFVGTMTVSCNNGAMSVFANTCGERAFASGMTGQSCAIENGVGTMMYKQLENGSFDPSQKSCQYISCLYGTEKVTGSCISLRPLIRMSYLLGFGGMPSADQEIWWTKEIKAKGLGMDQVMKAHQGFMRASKWEREHAIQRAYLKVFGIEATQVQMDAMLSLVFELDTNKLQVHTFSEMVTYLIKWSKDNEYLGRRSIITRSFQEAFGVEPSVNEMASLNVTNWANTYENLMLTHLKFLQGTDDIAKNGQINLANRIYQKLYQRNATSDEQVYIAELIRKGLLYNKIRDRVFVKDLHTRFFGVAPGDSWYQDYQRPEETAQTIAHKFISYSGFSTIVQAAGNDEQVVKWIYRSLFNQELTNTSLLNTYKSFLTSSSNKMSRVDLAHWMVENSIFISLYRPTGIKTSFQRTYYGNEFLINDNSGVNPTEPNVSNDYSSWAVRESASGLLGRKTGYMAYGPNASDFPQRQSLRAAFEMKIMSEANPEDIVFTIDVTVNGGAVVIAKKDVRRKDFTSLNQYRKFNLDFIFADKVWPTGQIEMRVHTKGIADITLYKVEVTELESIKFNAEETSVSYFNSGTGNLVFSIPNATQIKCRIDWVGAFSVCTNSVPFSSLTEGRHWAEISFADQNGVSQIFVKFFIVDLTAPTITISGDLLNHSSSGEIISISSEPVAYSCSINNGAYQACDSKFSYTGLAGGSNIVRVRALDMAGNVSTKEYNVVVDDTVIKTKPKSVVKYPTKNINFKVALRSGISSPLFQWYKRVGTIDQAPIDGATTKSYSFVQTLNSVGEYRVKVIYSADGSYVYSDWVRSDIPAIPAISVQPIGGEIWPGKDLKLSVTATGKPNYQWYKNGVVITNAKAKTYKAKAGPTVGKYKVLVTNLSGSVMSQEVEVSQTKVGQIVSEPNDIFLASGKKVTLEVKATGTDLKYQWYKDIIEHEWYENGINDIQFKKISGAISSTYEFKLDIENDGFYHLEISNNSGAVKSRNIMVGILGRPVINAWPSDCEASSGESCVFQVDAIAPDGKGLIYKWYARVRKNDKTIWTKQAETSNKLDTSALKDKEIKLNVCNSQEDLCSEHTNIITIIEGDSEEVTPPAPPAPPVDTIYGGGSTLPVSAYLGSAYLGATTTLSNRRSVTSTSKVPDSLYPATVDSLFGQVTSTSKAGKVFKISYCGIGSGKGRDVLRGFADATGTCGNYDTSPNGFSAPAGFVEADFAGSDVPFSASEYTSFSVDRNNVKARSVTRVAPIQLPAIAAAIGVIYNNSDLGKAKLNLTESQLCQVFSGAINNWSQLGYPSQKPIVVVKRDDSSGTTFSFTNHLSAACPTAHPVAVDGFVTQSTLTTKVVSTAMIASGNGGMVSVVSATDGSIGYADVADVKARAELTGGGLLRVATLSIKPNVAAYNENVPQYNADGTPKLKNGIRVMKTVKHKAVNYTKLDPLNSTHFPATIDVTTVADQVLGINDTDGRPTLLAVTPIAGATAGCVQTVDPHTYAKPALDINSDYTRYPIIAISYLMGYNKGNALVGGTDKADALRRLFGAPYSISSKVKTIGEETGFADLKITTGVGSAATTGPGLVTACVLN